MNGLYILDVGRGDCAVILADTPQGQKCAVIDSGSFVSRGSQTLVSFLQEYGVGAVDLAVITHLHSDHFGGFAALNGKIRVKQLIVPCDNALVIAPRVLERHPSKMSFREYRTFYETCVKQETVITTLAQCGGREFVFGKYTLKCLYPDETASMEPTQHAIAMTLPDEPEDRIDWHVQMFDAHINDDSGIFVVYEDGQPLAMLAGDAPLKTMEEALDREGVFPKIIKLSHHGEPDYFSQEWLKRMHPEMIVVTNSRLSDVSGICVQAAGSCGAKIHFSSDGMLAYEG